MWERRDLVITRQQMEQDIARLRKWLTDASAKSEKKSPMDDFLLEMTATKALNSFNHPVEANAAEEKAKKDQVHFLALNEARAKKQKEERLSSEHLRYPETRMKLFFKAAPSMSM